MGREREGRKGGPGVMEERENFDEFFFFFPRDSTDRTQCHEACHVGGVGGM